MLHKSDIAKTPKEKCNMMIRLQRWNRKMLVTQREDGGRQRCLYEETAQQKSEWSEGGGSHYSISRQVKQHVQGPVARMCSVSVRSCKDIRKLDNSIYYT